MMNARARTLRSFRMDNIKVSRLNYHKVLDFSSGLGSQLQSSTSHINFFEPPSELVQFSVLHFHLSFTPSIGSAPPFFCVIFQDCVSISVLHLSFSFYVGFFKFYLHSPFQFSTSGIHLHFRWQPPFYVLLIFLLNNPISVSQHLSSFTHKYFALHLLSRLTPPFQLYISTLKHLHFFPYFKDLNQQLHNYGTSLQLNVWLIVPYIPAHSEKQVLGSIGETYILLFGRLGETYINFLVLLVG